MATRTKGARGAEAGEQRRTIASYPRYEEAARAVERLAERNFPVERVAIVGRGLRMVERVIGREGYADAALRGALSGAFAGFLIGWLFEVFNWFNPVIATGWLMLQGLWFGALVGALIGLLAHALTSKRANLQTVVTTEADSYDVTVDPEVAAEAARQLSG